MSTVTLERRRVALGRELHGPFVTRFVVLDFDGKRYRCTYYRPRLPKEEGHPLGEDHWRIGVEEGWFSAKGKPGAWLRSGAAAASLGEALRKALDGVAPGYDDARGIEAYVRSTSWGAGLP